MTATMIQFLFLHVFISFECQTHENIDTYLSNLHQDGKLNGNVLVLKNGETLLEKSFGYADGDKSTALTKDYRFNIGSVYKEFPAVSIMQLHEKNLIRLEDKISKYILELPEWSKKISVKNLMQYSSGLPKIDWNTYFANGINVTEADILYEIKNIENLEFEPGSDYLYSNSNPILLIKIVEHITKSTFAEYVQENIFGPLALNSTVFNDQFPYVDSTLMAMPFNSDFEEDDYQLAVKSLLLSATGRDMATWFEQLGDFKVVAKSSVRLLSEKTKDVDHIQAPLGRCVWENERIVEHSHHGSSGNYECVVRRFKQDDVTIVILTNQKHGNVYDISDEIYEIIKRN